MWRSLAASCATKCVAGKLTGTRLKNSSSIGLYLNRYLAMGIIFGRVDVEIPKYEVAKSFDRDDYKYEIRRYPANVAAEVTSDTLRVSSSRFTNEAFRALAQYIGVYGQPANRKRESVAMTAPVQTGSSEREKVAMTAPVITTNEKVAMTAPVITTKQACGDSDKSQQEKIVMTAPVITTKQASGDSDRSEQEKIAMTAPVLTSGSEHQTMAFLLPSNYTIDTAPEPTDARVKLKEIPPRYEAVHQYSGLSDMTNCGPKVEQLYDHLRLDGVKVLEGGSWHLDRYNPPTTIPWLRTNEIHIPVEFDSEV